METLLATVDTRVGYMNNSMCLMATLCLVCAVGPLLVQVFLHICLFLITSITSTQVKRMIINLEKVAKSQSVINAAGDEHTLMICRLPKFTEW